MGIVGRLRRWINPTLSVQDLSVRLQTLSEMLAVQIEELESKSDNSRYHAGACLKKGYRDQAKHYVKMHLQYLSWAQQLLQYKANLEGLEVRLRQGDSLQRVVNIMEMVQRNLLNIQTSLPSMPQLARQADELTTTINQMQLASRVTDKTLNPALVPVETKESTVDETILQLEEELGMGFPSPIDARTVKAQEKLRGLGEH